MVAKCLDGIHIAHREVIIIPNGNLLNLMRVRKPSKKLRKGTLPQWRTDGQPSKIHNSWALPRKHCKVRLATRHDV